MDVTRTRKTRKREADGRENPGNRKQKASSESRGRSGLTIVEVEGYGGDSIGSRAAPRGSRSRSHLLVVEALELVLVAVSRYAAKPHGP